MTLGEQLLNLTVEYQQSVDVRDSKWGTEGAPAGREPSAIAADYEQIIRSLSS